MAAKTDENQNEIINNGHQKTVSGKKQSGPAERIGKGAGGNAGSKGQNQRDLPPGKSVGSHKPGGDGPGSKKFKHDHDSGRLTRDQERESEETPS
jgi:hypothetical protein